MEEASFQGAIVGRAGLLVPFLCYSSETLRHAELTALPAVFHPELHLDDCTCLTPPFRASDFDSVYLGVDTGAGRFGEVSLQTCRRCGRVWLHELIEVEGFSESGRWYRGLVPEAVAARVTPETALAVLEGLEWYFVGGSYYQSSGLKSSGPMKR